MVSWTGGEFGIGRPLGEGAIRDVASVDAAWEAYDVVP
jgi:hypothetical protein